MQIRAMVSSWRAKLRHTPTEAPPDAESVKAAELAVILGTDTHTAPDAVEPWGLALSGGGIRSATFGLGVLQALARNGLLGCFHYQSTVSGGGYIGAFLQGLIRRHGFATAFAVLSARTGGPQPQDADATRLARPIQHLREYSNYLSPRKTPFSGDTLGIVGTYVRNDVLVQLQLCALILALTLVPLLLHDGLVGMAEHAPALAPTLAGVLGMIAVGLLAFVTTYASRRTPAQGAPPPLWVAVASTATIWLLALAALVSALGFAHGGGLPAGIDALLVPLSGDPAWRLGMVGGLAYATMWLAWMVFDWALARFAPSDAPPSALQRHVLRFVFATAASALFAAVALVVVRGLLARIHAHGFGTWHVAILGPSLTMLGVTLTGILHVGLAGPALSDLQRESWARVGGKTAGLVIVGVTLTMALTVYGPWLLMQSFALGEAKWQGLGWAGVVTWLATTATGVLAARGTAANGDAARSKRGRLFDVVVRCAPGVFVLGLIVALSLAGQALVVHLVGAADAGFHVDPALSWRKSLGAYLQALDRGVGAHTDTLLQVMALALATWMLFGWAVDVNEFSLNAFYRNRLVRCYLGASNAARTPEPTTNFDEQDDLVLAELVEQERLHGRRPLFPLVGTAMNLVAAKQLDWQDRKAASFCLTPGFCGHLPPDTRPGAPVVGDVRAAIAGTATAGRPGDALASTLSLGSAIAISGAAVNPNMGYHSSPAVTFLLTLFDARLGWWLPNPGHPRHPRTDSSPFFGGWLLAELLGRTHEGGKFVQLSDGGHFENLALYELVRRRCRFILCVDAAADPGRAFGDLGNAVHKCRVDFGVEIRIDVSALRPGVDGRAARSCAVGDIVYPDGSTGTLLYLKPTLTGEEPTDIQHYASAHPDFPHESTADQFFDEAQFESYRRLGEDVASRAIAPALERALASVGTPGHAQLGVHDSAQKDKVLLALRQQWAASLPGGGARFAVHAANLSRLFGKLRDNPALAVLDAQFYPAWIDLVAPDDDARHTDAGRPVGRRTRLPAPAHFRDCFYFCQELAQLMEAVYHDLDFERNWDHPDHHGWMNAFRHWSGAPMFRIAWAMGSPSFGRRFVAFCERRLDLPRLHNDDRDHRALWVDEETPQPGETWERQCERLADAGVINHVEQAILLSEAMLSDPRTRPTRLFVLRLRWRTVLPRTGLRIPDTALGVAALSGTTLRLLRVQDHVRRLGLGAEFMRLLLDRAEVEGIDIRSGHYGLAGIYRRRNADEVAAHLQALHRRARRFRDAQQTAARGGAGPAQSPAGPPDDD
ncbi:MAG: hypothetical protein ACTHOH_00120 [Lysobacteraceae bacterium]